MNKNMDNKYDIIANQAKQNIDENLSIKNRNYNFTQLIQNNDLTNPLYIDQNIKPEEKIKPYIIETPNNIKNKELHDRSIRDRDKDRKIQVKVTSVYDFTIPLIFFLIILAFCGWVLYIGFSQKFDKNKNVNEYPPIQGSDPEFILQSDNTSYQYIECNPGDCATNILTGAKKCLSDPNQIIAVNPQTAVCNPKYLCTNGLTPYALQSDGSTNALGLCENGFSCNCMRTPTCPFYNTSVFTNVNGNPYIDYIGTQRISFPQIIPTSSNIDSNVFCNVSVSWLPLSTPGCNFVNINEAGSMNYNQLIQCMALQVPNCWGYINYQGCPFFDTSYINYSNNISIFQAFPNSIPDPNLDGFIYSQLNSSCNGCTAANNGAQCGEIYDLGNSSPCLSGTLAVITDNLNYLTQENISNAVVGCVTGVPCPCGQLSVYNTDIDQIICLELSYH